MAQQEKMDVEEWWAKALKLSEGGDDQMYAGRIMQVYPNTNEARVRIAERPPARPRNAMPFELLGSHKLVPRPEDLV